jgi:hypothetical protein
MADIGRWDKGASGAPSGDTLDRLRQLAAHASAMRAADFRFGGWHDSRKLDDGSFSMPWFERGPEADRFVRDAVALGFVRPFDWVAWIATPEAASLLEPDGVRSASVEQIANLLTALVRRDRFVEGALEAAFDSGLILAILERAAELSRGDR